MLETLTDPWVLIGLGGQACFAARFLLQWLVSEKRGQSVIPIGFWYLSLAGASVLLVYAVYRADPVFVLGQSFGFLVYVRNLVLLRRERGGGGPGGTPDQVLT